jgi:hypothetical protein
MANDPKRKINIALTQLIHTGTVDPETVVAVNMIVATEIDAWTESVTAEINQKITDWEATMGSQEDKSLYSLGLRRAIDVILGESAYSQLPILEKPSTPEAGD